MVRNVLWFVGGALVALGVSFGFGLRQAEIPQAPVSASLEASLDTLAETIREAGVFVRGHMWYGSEREQAEAHLHVVRALISGLEGHATMDLDFPHFYEIGPRNKVGMDNADQRYLSALLRGEGTYRVWGTRGTSRRLDFTLYGEDALAPSIATLETDALEVDEDGRVEVVIGGTEREGNWLPSRPGVVRLLIRQIHADWDAERPGDLHIDRIDEGRPAAPALTPEIMAARLDATSRYVAETVRRWPEMSRTRFHALLPANSLTPPRDTGAEGGLSGRLMVGGHFLLAPDEALIVTTWPSEAAYQGIQLGQHWWESLDYANRQTSLTTDQARRSSDGAYHFVIAGRDPGVPNWLDTDGFERGVILLRYDGLPVAELPDAEHPSARLVAFDEIATHLPPDEPRVSPAERAAAIAKRRRHVQQRFGL